MLYHFHYYYILLNIFSFIFNLKILRQIFVVHMPTDFHHKPALSPNSILVTCVSHEPYNSWPHRYSVLYNKCCSCINEYIWWNLWSIRWNLRSIRRIVWIRQWQKFWKKKKKNTKKNVAASFNNINIHFFI